MRGVPRIQELQLAAGLPPSYVSGLPSSVSLFSQHELPPETKSPLGAPTIAWAFKQTTFAAATFLYAAQAHGVATGPMEGFDEVRVREVLKIPERYKVAVVVALGYPLEGKKPHDTVRLPPTEVFFDGEFGKSSASIFEDSK